MIGKQIRRNVLIGVLLFVQFSNAAAMRVKGVAILENDSKDPDPATTCKCALCRKTLRLWAGFSHEKEVCHESKGRYQRQGFWCKVPNSCQCAMDPIFRDRWAHCGKGTRQMEIMLNEVNSDGDRWSDICLQSGIIGYNGEHLEQIRELQEACKTMKKTKAVDKKWKAKIELATTIQKTEQLIVTKAVTAYQKETQGGTSLTNAIERPEFLLAMNVCRTSLAKYFKGSPVGRKDFVMKNDPCYGVLSLDEDGHQFQKTLFRICDQRRAWMIELNDVLNGPYGHKQLVPPTYIQDTTIGGNVYQEMSQVSQNAILDFMSKAEQRQRRKGDSNHEKTVGGGNVISRRIQRRKAKTKYASELWQCFEAVKYSEDKLND